MCCVARQISLMVRIGRLDVGSSVLGSISIFGGSYLWIYVYYGGVVGYGYLVDH